MKKQTLILFFIFTVIILFLHSPNVFLHKSLWAEDGSIFFTEAAKYGYFSLFRTHAGYYHAIPRFVAIFSFLFPTLIIPYIYLIYVILVEFTAVAATYQVFKLDRIKYGFLIAFIPIIVPVVATVYDNLTNMQWILAYLFLLLITQNWSKFNKLFLILSVLLLSLTGPFSILVLPVMIARIIIFKDFKEKFPVYFAYGIGFVCQSLSVINSSRVSGNSQIFSNIFDYCLNFVTCLSSYKFIALVIFLLAVVALLKCSKNYKENFITLSLFYFGFITLGVSLLTVIKANASPVGFIEDRYYYLYVLSVLLMIIFTFKNKYITLFLIFASLLSFSRRDLYNINWDQYVKLSKFQDIVYVPIPPTFEWYAEIRNPEPLKRSPDATVTSLTYFTPQNICKGDYIALTAFSDKLFRPAIVSRDLDFFTNVVSIKTDDFKYKFNYVLPLDNKEYKIIAPLDLKINCYCLD